MSIKNNIMQVKENIRFITYNVWKFNKLNKKNPSPGELACRFGLLIKNLMQTSSFPNAVILLKIFGNNITLHKEKPLYTETHGIKALAAIEIMAAICNVHSPIFIPKNEELILCMTNKIFQELDGTLNERMSSLPESTIERIIQSVEINGEK